MALSTLALRALLVQGLSSPGVPQAADKTWRRWLEEHGGASWTVGLGPGDLRWGSGSRASRSVAVRW